MSPLIEKIKGDLMGDCFKELIGDLIGDCIGGSIWGAVFPAWLCLASPSLILNSRADSLTMGADFLTRGTDLFTTRDHYFTMGPDFYTTRIDVFTAGTIALRCQYRLILTKFSHIERFVTNRHAKLCAALDDSWTKAALTDSERGFCTNKP